MEPSPQLLSQTQPGGRLRPLLALLLTVPFFLQAQVDSLAVADSSSYAPLRRTPWSSHRITRDDLFALPSRELRSYLPLVPGVSEVDGDLHIRGTRGDAVFYGLDGFGITNPMRNSPILELIPEAVEYVDVHTGPYGAQYGRATGGLVMSRMREGGDEYRFSALIRTDEFARPGSEIFGTTVQGYRTMTLTASGPVTDGIRFFVAGQNRFLRNRQPMFLEPFRFDSLRVDSWDARYQFGIPDSQQATLPSSVTMGRNYVPGNWAERNTLQGNVVANVWDLRVKVMGSYSFDETSQGGWPWIRRSYLRQDRVMTEEASTFFLGVSVTHSPFEWLDLSASLGRSKQTRALVDPHFGENWRTYTDSLENARIGFADFRRRFAGPFDYSTLRGLSFYHEHRPNTSYEKFDERSDQISFSGSARITDRWNIAFGLSSEAWTLRRFSVLNIQGLMEYLYGVDGTSPATFPSDAERQYRSTLRSTGYMPIYGYDADGNVTDDVPFRPYEPSFASAYLEQTYSADSYSISGGLRYERFHPRLRHFENEDMPPLTAGWDPNDSLSLLTVPYELVLPRVAMTIRPGPSWSLRMAYGTYAQFPEVQGMLMTTLYQSYYWYSGGFALKDPVPAGGVRPERSSHLEVGVDWKSEDGVWSISGTWYRKLLPNQMQLARFDTSVQSSGMVWKNDGEASATGIEVLWSMTPSEKLVASIRYAYSLAEGTQTYPRSNWADLYGGAPQGPDVLFPLGYNRTHTASVFLDLRFNEEDGVILEGLRVLPVLSIWSGRRFTRENEIIAVGSSNPYTIGIRSILDPRASDPIEGPNASTTPWIINMDLHVAKSVAIGPVVATFSLDILNLMNRKHVLNVYTVTGSPGDDGWLNSSLADLFPEPGYSEAYEILNNQNREHYIQATGSDIYGMPRQIRFGVTVEM